MRMVTPVKRKFHRDQYVQVRRWYGTRRCTVVADVDGFRQPRYLVLPEDGSGMFEVDENKIKEITR